MNAPDWLEPAFLLSRLHVAQIVEVGFLIGLFTGWTICAWWTRVRSQLRVSASGGASSVVQSIVGDGNVMSSGDIVGEPPYREAAPDRHTFSGTINGMKVRATSPDSSVRVSASGRGFTLTMGETTVEVEK